MGLSERPSRNSKHHHVYSTVDGVTRLMYQSAMERQHLPLQGMDDSSSQGNALHGDCIGLGIPDASTAPYKASNTE